MGLPATDLLSIELYDQPGHLIRRAQQIAVSRFFEALGREVTPLQYASCACCRSGRASTR